MKEATATKPSANSFDAKDDSSLGSMWAGLKIITAKAMEGVSKAAFDFYGTPSDAYGPSVDELFAEAFFIE